jgi:hypothetical protein
MPKHPISRRQFLFGSTVALAGALLPGGLRVAQPPGVRCTPAARAQGLGRAAASGPIIADHTVVAKYADIPQAYIDEVKKMWLNVPGESHSAGYRIGVQLLENLDSTYAVNVTESGSPEGPTDHHLRVNRAVRTEYSSWAFWGTGESVWYTWRAWNPSDPSYPTAAAERLKNHLTYANTNGPEIAAMGFGWCWDMTWQNGVGGTIDPMLQVRWAGSSEGGPDGSQRWGLDSGDEPLTGNDVCMDTYLLATEEYIAHCVANGYPTEVFFTTGPVDGGGNTGESGYQRYLKHQHIRNHVTANSRILFDYADILCWGDDGVQNLVTWTDHGGALQTFPYIHSDNMKDLDGTYAEDGDHIGERGALRLAKAMWRMLARIAGWEPEGPSAPTGLSATPITFYRIDLAWTASTDPDAVEYVIYRDGEQIATCAGTSYSDTSVGPCREYTYTVASCDDVGQVGSPCDPASATTPEAPYNVSVPLVMSE